MTETVGREQVKRIADEIERKIHRARMELRARWRELRPRLHELERELRVTRARTSAAIERELAAIGAALHRLHTDVSTPDPRARSSRGSTAARAFALVVDSCAIE